MDTAESGISLEKMHENSLMINTIQALDDEKQNILFDVLKCVVCFELPVGKQVKICEKGHHFCHTCHRIMRVCGVCRGPLVESRNFVVEDLVTKLAPILGISRCKLPPAEPPCALSPGLFECPHKCSAKMPASLMLPHLRDRHAANLIDNVRSNPYSGRFSFTYDIKFIPNEKFIWSAQVSDMGLFTVVITFFDNDFFGCVRLLGDKTVASLFRYQLSVKISNENSESSLEFSVSNCTVLNYLDDIDSVKEEEKGLKIKREGFLGHISNGSPITVFFSVWKSNETIKSAKGSTIVCMPENCLFFTSDRKIRRNRNRNMRRRQQKETRRMLEEFSHISL